MSKQFGSIALAAAVLVAGAGAQSNIARAAEECLAAPNAGPPQGSHWYYRTDRVKQQKCWYLRSPGQTAQQVAPEDTAETVPAAQSASAPMSSTAINSVSPRPQVGTITPQPVTATFDDVAKRSSAQEQTAPQTQPSPSATAKWPDPAPRVFPPSPEERVASPLAATPADASPLTRKQLTADARGADIAQSDSELNPKPGNVSDGLLGSLTASPLGMFLIVAMALGMAGLLSRAIMKIASSRRPQLYADHEERDWVKSIPPEDAPSIAARPLDLAYEPDEPTVPIVPDEHTDRIVNDLDSALRRFMRERERRAA